MVSSEIIKSCINGNRSAQKALYQSCAPYVYAIVKSYIYEDDTRKDIMQEAFIGIFKSVENFNSEKGTFKSWLGRIATNKCIDHLKSKSNLFFASLDVVEDITEDHFNHLDQLSQQEIEDLLIDMPIGYKTIFLLCYIDEYDHNEIASMLEITADTSRSQLHRALKWLKKNFIETPNRYRNEAFQ